MISEEELEASTYEGETRSDESSEEYNIDEEVVDVKELDPNDIDMMLRRSELWDKLVSGVVSIEEARKIISELVPAISAQGVRRRRRS
ncbi:MAG TPA: hypothetical protein EYP48_01035 [Ignisphaera sp.]|uniref:RNA polymerase Rpo13 subunit HTH domain-containing protein n=1 Tax=Ignisphaera aggregans TaxID=334771 RepID=A0A832Z2X0_9CREN|nr:hypothetical protein [Ignisphaera sp.]HIP56918.1 hypothetical protein [Ignisphaera aggregans]